MGGLDIPELKSIQTSKMFAILTSEVLAILDDASGDILTSEMLAILDDASRDMAPVNAIVIWMDISDIISTVMPMLSCC